MRKASVNTEDTFFPQVGIWACWIIIMSMATYGFFYVVRYLCCRRGRSS
jgi:hypothetical protein